MSRWLHWQPTSLVAGGLAMRAVMARHIRIPVRPMTALHDTATCEQLHRAPGMPSSSSQSAVEMSMEDMIYVLVHL